MHLHALFASIFVSRFHVFSAHCLCEEDLRSFDPKINNENLTKCLQSLKQYYADLNDLQVTLRSLKSLALSRSITTYTCALECSLQLRSRVSCVQHSSSTRSGRRLAVNGESVLFTHAAQTVTVSSCSEVLTLSPAVRQSTAVKFALAVHSAYSSNNYVRFFRLVR